ncbi:WecB/TagA/CpsF family glycosyltransferase [Tabrizicola sp.]|uniref:WecB/TagA/CpsF family glycosyltransferase n=1 Tax=Tabrizicola sp. TaxID=2005166 RepID=UPI00273728AA|nr:WecB/TagA/CpsF family glycosyltransferase [Tabrizicola sp.]MDP3194726.1 WecB/TagA/CpsF family glycosyltransferase [Tabrizicola sp.]
MNDRADAGADALALVNFPTEAALLADVEARLTAGRGFAIATLNLDHVVKMRRDSGFRRAYGAHSHVVADGNPIVWLSRLAGRRQVALVPGSELIEPVAALAARLGTPLAFLGSTETVLQAAAAQLKTDHPGLEVAACLAPPYGFDPESAAADALLDQVAASGARICLLALGAPKQEVLAARGLARHPQLGFLSIGAGLDFIAGHQVRAPVWVRKIAMEWLWRMLSNPRRLARRYLDCALVLPSLTGAALTERRRK